VKVSLWQVKHEKHQKNLYFVNDCNQRARVKFPVSPSTPAANETYFFLFNYLSKLSKIGRTLYGTFKSGVLLARKLFTIG
jgi:hypothetical protein